MAIDTFFSAGPINRHALSRSDADTLAALLDHAATRFIPIWQSQCLIADDGPVYLSCAELGGGWQREYAIYLGELAGQQLLAVSLANDLPQDGPQAEEFASHSSLLAMSSADDGAILAYAKGMVEWQQRHLYCGLCGAPNISQEGGFVMVCSNDACAHRCFPRVDPAIIVLVTHDERCLLGRQTRWPEGRFSTIAGFVEPGESLEDAVRREVREETNVQVGKVHYLGSQPWPFPSAMMIGFHAEARSTDIVRNDGELAEAGWFTREQLAAGAVNLPPQNSIAFRLIEAWFDRWDGPRLANLNLCA